MSNQYEIVYTSENSGFVAGANQNIASLLALEVVVDRVTAKLKNMTKGADKTLNQLATAAAKANGALGTLDGTAKGTATSVGKVGSAAKGTTTQTAEAGKAVSSLSTRMGNAAGKATTLGNSLATAGSQMNVVAGSANLLTNGLGGVNTSSRSAGGGLRTLVKAGGGLSVVAGLAASLSEALKESREFAHECAEDVLKLEDSVRELRATVGGKTTTKQATDSVVKLMLESGADQKAATAFETLWESTVPAAKKKGNWGLTDAETKDAKVQALRFAVASGIDEKTLGEVVPSIAIGEKLGGVDQQGNKIDGVNQLLGKLGTMTSLAVEGVGNFTPLMKVYEKLRGSMVREKGGGAVKSSEELMAVIGTASVESGKEAAATRDINQAWRDLSVAGSKKKQKTFEKYGITGTDDFETRVNKIAPLIEDAQRDGVNELEAMRDAGFTNAYANLKIINFVQDRELLGKNLEAARRAPSGAAVRAGNERFKAEQPNRFAENAVQAAKLKRGEETKDLEVLRKFAEADAMNNAGLGRAGMNMFENVVDMKIPGVVPFIGGKSVSQDILGQEAAREKIKDALISQHILKAVPGAAERFPDLSGQIDVPFINRLNPTFTPARGERLAEIIRGLTPEERQKVTAEMEESAKPSSQVPAGRAAVGAGAAGAIPAAGGVGPQAMNGGAIDPKLLDVNRQQADLLRQIVSNQRIGMGAGATVPGGNGAPLPVDGGDFGGIRS